MPGQRAPTRATTARSTWRCIPAPRPATEEGGASPDEAIADSAEAPHPVTTPDDPADVVDVDDTK